jgi:enoyl-CoA hydratase/carnithine racemase
MGGTQRLVRAVGPYVAADLVLTGRLLTAAEAATAGLVSRVIPATDLLAETEKVAASIADKSLVALFAAKAALDAALETSLAEGLRFEKPRVLRSLRHGGPEGGHGRLPREARAGVHEPVTLSLRDA